ncbi:MAG: MFS transporter [Gammaproteobacteria bacterium]|nr:MFS transporter [Gammaproteobacteria bacterium]
MNATTDPRDLLDRTSMSTLQIIAVVITIGLNGLDGFDVMSISFASPGIAAEWGIDRAALGIVMSMELIGMALGSVLLGGVADNIGRRKTILGCLVVMTIGMFMATTATSPVNLSIWRVLTGLGIGGMLAAINASAAEFSNGQRRNLSVSLMAIGYPVGSVLGGLVAKELLKDSDWRSVFYFGAAITAAFIPIVYLLVPESVHWLTRKQPPRALERINATLVRFGKQAVAALPPTPPAERKGSLVEIFAPGMLRITVIMTLVYFLHITTFYYIIKWVPKIVVDMGFDASSAAGVLVWLNVGGATGGVVLGLLTQRFGLKGLTIAVMVASTVAVTAFGYTPADLDRLSLICAVCGFFVNGGIVGLYAMMAQVFPTQMRASGTGFAIGCGRGGSVLAPIIAGFLFTGGLSLVSVSMIMSLGSIVAAAVLLLLKYREPVTARA